MKRKTMKLLVLVALLLPGVGAVAQSAGTEKPKAYMVSNAHLDTQWNWDIQTTIREYVWNTINQNLFLLKKYPNYIFNFEGCVKYSWMKEYYPKEYEELKQFIKDGRWHITGSSWDANDVLVPSAESLIRNIMLGQTYYRTEFGTEGTDIFLPDCFGFGWTLPTVASHCGLIGFSSQKLGWRTNPFFPDKKKIPYTFGKWVGVDGFTIMMAHGYDYNKKWELGEDLTNSKLLVDRAKEHPLNQVFHYYGTGDIGGSPTTNSIDAVNNSVNGDGPIQIISATSDQLFKSFLPYDKHPELPSYTGELLMDVHGTGCYTSQATMKLYNRQNELLGDASERSSVAADLLGLADYPSKSLTESWRRFIFHQFHDDLTGTSIPRAYEFSWNDEMLSMKQFSNILKSSVGAVSEQMDTRVKGIPVVMYNAQGFDATDAVEVIVDAARCPKTVAAYNPQGQQVAAQLVGYEAGKAHVLIEATVPANGYAVYDLRLSGIGNAAALATAAQTIENSIYKLTLNNDGDITSLFDKKNNKELVKSGKVIRLALFTENESFSWPAWEVLKKTIDATPISITEGVKMTMVENGALRKTLCVEKQHGDSKFRQYIRLYEGALADRIDFYNEINWLATNALLKAEFPLNLDNEKATYDLGIGNVERGNNQINAYEVYAHYWADLTDKSNDYGVTVMNNAKYGWDKPDNNTIRLTLLHTPKTQRGYRYQDHQDHGYHTFTYSLVGHAGGLQKAQTYQKAENLNQRIKAFSATKHAGTLGKSFSLASSNNASVAIKALKKAEVSDEYVVRVYERDGKSVQDATLTFAADIVSAVEADGTEKTIGQASFNGKQLNVNIKPNSIKTYKVKLAKQPKKAQKYEQLALNFDKVCATWNEMTRESNFEGGYAYAAELLPSELTVNRIPFRIENKALLNGMKCEGDTLTLPAGHKYTRLYILAASATPANESVKGTFRVGKSAQEIRVPSYTGFIGQWEHIGHTTGYMDETEVAYVGTHRHSTTADEPYEFTYMFKHAIDIPAKATEIILPNTPNIVLFAATLVEEAHQAPEALSELFRLNNEVAREELPEPTNILKAEHITAWTGAWTEEERAQMQRYARRANGGFRMENKPEFLLDGNRETAWMDSKGLPSYVEFDLGTVTDIKGWKVSAASFRGRTSAVGACYLMGRNDKNEEWRTIDFFTGNKQAVVNKYISNPAKARYLKLMVVQPTTAPNGQGTRIGELSVF